MQRIAKFEKVSEEEFIKTWKETFPEAAGNAQEHYNQIILPKRATAGSAGYDFHSTNTIVLHPGETVKIPTGIRVWMEEGWVLHLYPRSGLGFKYRLQLNNTVGIIDSDYYFAENEGHIQIKITNDSKEGRVLQLAEGDAFAQGVFLEYGITIEDEAKQKRTGGLGSTG